MSALSRTVDSAKGDIKMLTIHDRPAAGIYEAIYEANSNTELYTATVISGNAIGEKALFADGAICWCSDDQ